MTALLEYAWILSAEEQKLALQKLHFLDADVKEVLQFVPLSYPKMKGSDYIVFNSAKLIGLPVHVKPLLVYWNGDNPISHHINTLDILWKISPMTAAALKSMGNGSLVEMCSWCLLIIPVSTINKTSNGANHPSTTS